MNEQTRAFRSRLAESAPYYPPAPPAAAPCLPPSTPSSGARGGAGDLLNGGVFERPACVDRLLRRRRIRLAVAWIGTVLFLLAVEVVVIALVMGAGRGA